MDSEKRITCIVLDAAPLLLNQPSISTLLATAERIYTVPAVIAEIRDANARQRLETTVLPFLTTRIPSAKSIERVSGFAKKSGDYAVLSKPDLHVLALAYELECEQNLGDWRLRSTPGQKRLNGSPPTELASKDVPQGPETKSGAQDKSSSAVEEASEQQKDQNPSGPSSSNPSPEAQLQIESTDAAVERVAMSVVTDQLKSVTLDSWKPDTATTVEAPEGALASEEEDSDGEGWITPSNLRRQQQKAQDPPSNASRPPSKLQVATITTDFALQNTLLLMNLNLLSTSLGRVSHLKSHVLRCHACFKTTKEMSRQFCDRCGQPALTRVTCTTSANGEFKLHLKNNMQWNHRGDRYSIPKPVSGTSSGKTGKGGRGNGGKGGWGTELMLSEDQKEYTRAVNVQERQKHTDIMDPDYLPSILTGERSSTGKVKVGAGRNVNSKKR